MSDPAHTPAPSPATVHALGSSPDAAHRSALPPMDVSGRLPRLRGALGGAECDAVLVTSLTNIRYLTGFTGSAGMLFVLPDEVVLVTDGRYETQSAEQLAAAGVAVRVEIGQAARQTEVAKELVSSAGAAFRLGLEATHVSWARQRAMADLFPDVDLVATVGLVEELRRIKDAGEIARVAEAARIADAALASVRPLLADAPTEVAFGQALDAEMRRLGATSPSFETIVASGPNAAKPHHRPSQRTVGRHELIVLDFGALVDGYCSDMTRTLCAGEPAGELLRVVEVVLASQAAGVAAVRAGVACVDVDRACREVIADAGWGERFVHGTGHGVGLDIHEAPAVAATSSDTLAAGHVVTVEPGVYLAGVGGARIEDTVVVTHDGCWPVTTTSKDLYL
ncbi:MAG: M24 family metallopeptidase [Acidimicrobiales bacterium]